MAVSKENNPHGINLGFLFAFITLIGDGFQTIVNKTRPAELSPLFFAWTSACVELVLLIPFLLRDQAMKQKIKQKDPSVDTTTPFTKKAIVSLVVAGIIFAFCAYYLIVGFSLVDSVTGILAVKTQPISMMVIGAVLLKERLSIKEIAIGIVMVVLMFYIVTGGSFQLGNLSIGVIILLFVAVFWNFGHSIAKPFLQKRMLTVNELVFIRIGITSVVLGLLYAIIGDRADLARGAAPDSLVSTFLMGLLFAFLHTCWYRGVRSLPLSIVSFIVLPSPIITAILTFFITHEPLFVYHYIGLGGEILCMVFLIIAQKKKAMLTRVLSNGIIKE